MVHDRQVRKLHMLKTREETLEAAASKSGMDEKTARKYLRSGKLPSQSKIPHTWKTRKDPFADVWEDVRELLGKTSGLEAKTIFEDLQRTHEGLFADGQLRTLQRKVKRWRALEGPGQETFFPQIHEPGDLGEMDFTSMNDLRVTLGGLRFDHMILHFVLTYSNWDTGTICFSESFESLSLGLQNALWELGGVPRRIRTDQLSAAVHQECREEAGGAECQQIVIPLFDV
jgi:transposase